MKKNKQNQSAGQAVVAAAVLAGGVGLFGWGLWLQNMPVDPFITAGAASNLVEQANLARVIPVTSVSEMNGAELQVAHQEAMERIHEFGSRAEDQLQSTTIALVIASGCWAAGFALVLWMPVRQLTAKAETDELNLATLQASPSWA